MTDSCDLRLEEKDIRAAAALIDRAHRAQADAESSILLGRIALASEPPRVARSRFQEALELARRHARRTEARTYLGQALLASSDPREAVRHLEEALSETPSMPEAWSALATARRRLGEADGAEEAAQRAAAAQSLEDQVAQVRRRLRAQAPAERSLSYLRLATLAAQSKSRRRRLDCLATALYVDPQSAEAYRRLADAYEEPRDVFLRLNALKQLLVLRPDDAAARAEYEELVRSLDTEE